MTDILDILLDADNCEPIVLTDKNGRNIAFEQIAVIPYDGKIYCVLKPVDKICGIGDDEAIVFRIDEDDDAFTIRMEEDMNVAATVFEMYYDTLEDALRKKAGGRR